MNGHISFLAKLRYHHDQMSAVMTSVKILISVTANMLENARSQGD